MTLPSNVGRRTVSDPLALRALAHPVRLRIYELVAREGTLTSAAAARQLGISHALASHHLRQLAKYGFVEPAGTTDLRARPWRVVSTSQDFEPAEAVGRRSADFIDRHTVERAAADLADWQQRRDEQTEQWRDRTGVFGALLYLTPAEMDEYRAALDELVHRLADRRPIGRHDVRPPEAQPISITVVAVPLRPTVHGG